MMIPEIYCGAQTAVATDTSIAFEGAQPVGCAAAQSDRLIQTSGMQEIVHIESVDLAADAGAAWAVKDETGDGGVRDRRRQFAERSVGANRYAAGDALVTGSTGDRWCVSRTRFDAKYEPQRPTQSGKNGQYRNRPVPILAKRMERAFSVARTAGGDVLRGVAGDWLVQYGLGDYGIVCRRAVRCGLPTFPRRVRHGLVARSAARRDTVDMAADRERTPYNYMTV